MRYILPQPRALSGYQGLGEDAPPIPEIKQPTTPTITPGVYHYPEAKIDHPGVVIVVPTGAGGKARLRELLIPALVSGITTFASMAAFSIMSGWWEKNRHVLGLPPVKTPGAK